jgi:hypothetical protein
MALELGPDLPPALVPLAWLFLHYASQTWLLDDEGAKVRPLASEVGYWRPANDGVEVLLTHPTGYVEIYVGEIEGPRVTLRTDLVARTESALEYTAASRMYGLVDGDLMWVLDMAAVGQPLQSHASAQLKRVE